MKIERPWAAQGDYFEVMVPDDEDWTAALARIPEPSPEERLQAVQRYLQARFGDPLGTRCPGCGASDDVPMDSAPLPEADDEARSYCVTCGRRLD